MQTIQSIYTTIVIEYTGFNLVICVNQTTKKDIFLISYYHPFANLNGWKQFTHLKPCFTLYFCEMVLIFYMYVKREMAVFPRETGSNPLLLPP